MFLLSLCYGWDDNATVYPYSIHKFLKFFSDKISLNKEDGSLSDKSIESINQEIIANQQLLNQNQSKINSYKAKLTSLGYTPAEYYLLYQGHTLMGFVQNLIFKFAKPIRSAKIREILSNREASDTQREEKTRKYHSATSTIPGEELSKSLMRMIQNMNFATNTKGAKRIKDQIEALFI